MTAPWEVRQDPRDPNAWDIYQGSAKIAHLGWCEKSRAEYMARAFNCHEELVAALRSVIEGNEFQASWGEGLDPDALEIAQAALTKAEGTK